MCAGCGAELRREPAPPDPVYGLPVCVCPGCGVACVRRKHRMRTHPVAFRRLDRAFNMLALAAVIVGVSAGTALAVAVGMASIAARDGGGPFMATLAAVRSSRPEELFSVGLLVGCVGMILAISGVLVSRVLWHWRARALVIAWGVVMALMAVVPTALAVYEIGVAWPAPPLGERVMGDILDNLPDRAQVLAACWLVTACGIGLDRAVSRGDRGDRKFRRSLRWARKRVARRRAG